MQTGVGEFHDQAGCVAAKLPNPPTAVNILTLLLESECCAIRSWIAICDVTFGKDPRTYDLAARILKPRGPAWLFCQSRATVGIL
jgi:ferritin-like protein